MLQRMIARGATIFLTSHVLEIVERLCTHIGIIHRGQLVAQGSIEELRAGVRRHARAKTLQTPLTLEQIFLEIVGQPRGNLAASAAGTGALVAQLDERPPIPATTQLLAIAWHALLAIACSPTASSAPLDHAAPDGCGSSSPSCCA